MAARFGDFLVESVLDVGCYEAPLRERLTNAGVRYFGVDIAGSPDQRIDLEKTDRLPFDDGQFHTVMCIEVLEHIDNCHAIFDELLRVASHYALVSLPNCWQGARTRIERGQGDFAHYGLPTE
ncbi:MAG: class I SAM-dependent methyltransferase, partial [Planctomycetales bacterium]|nr:class I SAM-dependent methyltransferase [Planctomycetales bacterium]